ncbi:hypothetical protein LSH36_3g08039 [Paralvinella palmiformis]|uniref:Fanconi anemia group I protein n=1 Tax=Paralvinella palmiformis TaxID=53620 RepID=A0AAD9NIZ7_9ANNE|nr:hypothetical protein LSH36_3g08039 [Paralvinella palmiformis]
MVSLVIESEDDSHSPKEAVQLLLMINTLTKQLDKDGEEIAQILEWLRTICTEQNIDDVPLTKLLMSQLFKLSTQGGSCVQLLRHIAVDIHSQLGDIDQEVELNQSSTMSIINQCTAAPTILLLLLTQMDMELDDTEWVMTMLNGMTASAEPDIQDDDSTECTQREKQEKSLCSRLGYLVNTFHELCQSAVPAGVCVMSLIKVLCHLYSVLTGLVKYYLHSYQMKHGYITTRFEKLVKLSATNLTSYVYAMITYLQATQSEALKLASEKTKKNKKKQEAVVQAGKNHVLKESKSIPNLIFAIEQYERYLIQLSKKSKIHLMDHFKMSTARDFRINVACLQEALQDSDDHGNEEDGEEDIDQSRNQTETPGNEAEAENQEPPLKRSKTAEQSSRQKSKQKLKKCKKN